jgi:hypothetical protein
LHRGSGDAHSDDASALDSPQDAVTLAGELDSESAAAVGSTLLTVDELEVSIAEDEPVGQAGGVLGTTHAILSFAAGW